MTRRRGPRPAPGRRLLLLVLLLAGCGDEGREGPQVRGMAASAAPGAQREQILGPFLARHWELPVPPQGEPPPHYSDAERSLEPQICGACHPKQLAEWKTSLHSGAFSPGFAGQLIEGDLAHPFQVRSCQTCHAPLSEQQPFTRTLEANPRFDASLRAQGVLCAGCHVRRHRYFGPPPRPDAPSAVEPRPHDGFEIRPEYLESRFCAECHQFFDDAGVNGKPLQNTFVEWQQSPQAAAGRQCQDCHMPDRAHLWRGIHDPDTVRQAVDVELIAAGDGPGAALVVRNRDVGHAFPTYTTPRVFLALFQVDAAGSELPGTRIEGTIGREIDFSAGRELFDTRVLPGESVQLDYALPRRPEAVALLGRVTVDPAYHYRGVFEALLDDLRDAGARALIEAAGRRTWAARFVLAEIRRPY